MKGLKLGLLQLFYAFLPALFFGLTGAIAAPVSADFVAIPPVARIVDKASLLDAATVTRLQQSLQAFETAKGAQISVLVVPTTQPEAIFDFSLRVAEAWKLGRKGIDDGVLFVIAKDDRKMQILTGAGTQGVLTDAMSKRIIAETVAPKFRSGNFGGGIEDGVAQIISVLSGEALPAPKVKNSQGKYASGMDYQSIFFVVLFSTIFIFRILRSLIGRFFGSAITAGLIGGGAALFGLGLAVAIGLGLLVFVATFIFGALGGSRGGSSSGWGWSTGGGGGGSSSSGGDSFSGGGGSFDGGGASGDW
jgi:uncharacterized protein